MEESNVLVNESRAENMKEDTPPNTVEVMNVSGDSGTVPSEAVTLTTGVENLQTTPVPTAVYATANDNSQNYFLVRLMHPKSVPLLVLSGEPDKPGVEVKGAGSEQLGANTARLHLDGSTLQAVAGNSSSLVTLQQNNSQLQKQIKGCEKGTDKVEGEEQFSNRIILSRCNESAELLLMHQTPVNINEEVKNAEINLKRVNKLHNGPKEKQPSVEKQFICEVEGCGRSFSSMGYLRYHQAVHLGQKSLKCPYEGCDRKFSWPAHLKYHQMTHTGDRRFKCTVSDCGKMFYTTQSLSVHLRTHTGEKPFVCEEPCCGKSFTTAGNLKNHSRVHTGERPYLCTFQNCGRQFAEYSSLKKHKLTHTGEKPYSCDICGRTFSQSGSQKVHMRGHLKIRPSKKHKRQKNAEPAKQNVVVLRQEDILQYQDFQGSESVVFSQADHVVTVTTQPSDRETDQLSLHPEILGVEEVLTSEECIPGDGLCGSNTMGANVVVLSQPQEIVSMATEFTSGDRSTQEEVVYGSDLLHSDLDHEEIARNISQPGISESQAISHHSPVRGTEQEVAMDPMMETDDESESEDQVWVEND